jgi:hypothetical protein
MRTLTFLLIFIAGPAINLRAQDLEKLKDLKDAPIELLKKGIKISGMAGANFVYYNASGIDNRNIPFNTLFTGNLNVDLFGKIKMPVSFSLSNQNINWSHPFDRRYQFMQPFNRFVLKPTYKGFTLHAGVCSLNFSPYTLAGHRYDGVGLEYKPKDKPFFIGIMYGNLKRAVRVDSTFETFNNIASYKRRGAGIQLGYLQKEDKIEVIFFTAADKVASLPYSLDAYGIMPEQNSVASLKGAKSITKKWLAETEIAISGLTLDSRSAERENTVNIFNSYFGTLSPKNTTIYKKAIKGTLTYRGKGFNAGAEYTRIDPGYRTLGAYYFANDLETYSGKIAGQLLQGKLNASANIGLQQDNVQKQKLKTLKRWVGTANITYVPAEWLNLMMSYSNFTSFSNMRPVYDYLSQVTPYQSLDTLNFRQINQNIQGGATITLPTQNEDIAQNLGLNIALQRGTDQNSGVSQDNSDTKNNLSNTSLDYTYGIKSQKLNLSASLYYSGSNIADISATQWGPTLGFTKGFGKEGQWKTMGNLTYSLGSMSGVDQKMLNARVGLGASLTKQLNLNCSIIYLNRRNISTERAIPSFSEFTGTLGLVYNFSIL